MATMPEPIARYSQTLAGLRGDIERRWGLAVEPCDDERAVGPRLWLFVREFGWWFENFRRPFRKIDITPAKEPKRVMVIPGFATHPIRMKYFARQLERAGHRVKRWGLGINWGTDEQRFSRLEERLVDVFDRKDRKLVLIGWSLGGIYARELARRHPDKVEKVITMGSPFSYSPRANNLWRIYQFVAGHRVDTPPIDADVSAKPPVETVALWSVGDGVIHPRAARGLAHERDRAIGLRGTHMDYCYSKECLEIVAQELDREPDDGAERA